MIPHHVELAVVIYRDSLIEARDWLRAYKSAAYRGTKEECDALYKQRDPLDRKLDEARNRLECVLREDWPT